MSSLTDTFPEAVPVTLDGEVFDVSEYRVRDVARLQRYLEVSNPHPYAAVRDRYEETGDKALLRGAYLADRDWRPRFGSRESEGRFRTLQGRAVLLSVVLGRHQDVPADRIFDLAERTLTVVEVARQYRRMMEVVNGYTARDAMEDAIRALWWDDDGDDDPVASREDAWSRKVFRLCETYGWTVGQVGDLTLTQFGLALNGGEPVPRTAPVRGGDWKAAAARRREALGFLKETNG